MQNPFSALVKSLDKRVTDEIQAKASIGAAAVLAQAPILDDLLDGKPVDLVMTIQLKRKV